jgi:hypothetical protein
LGRGKGILKGKVEGVESRLSVGKSIGGANEEKEHAAARQEKGEISYAESFTKNHEKEKTEQRKGECMIVHTCFCMEELGNCTVQLR